HDYRKPGRRHYYGEDGESTYEKSKYGRYVREANSFNLIRLDSDSDSDDNNNNNHDNKPTQGWHHNKDCPTNCRVYHYDTKFFKEKFSRSRENTFYNDHFGRWIKDIT